MKKRLCYAYIYCSLSLAIIMALLGLIGVIHWSISVVCSIGGIGNAVTGLVSLKQMMTPPNHY